MSVQPVPLVPKARPEKIRSRPGGASETIDGLDGPVELRRAPGGHLEVWPRPTPDSLRELYGKNFYETEKDSYLQDYERDRSYWDATWSMRRMLIEAALPESRRRILDVGSSGGFLLDHFQNHGWRGVGIEPSRSAAGWARERFGLEVFCGELLDYPTPTPTSGATERSESPLFDAIHSAQVLEHVLEPEACVERIGSLLAPDGVAYIEVPNDFNVFQQVARERLGKPAWWVAPKHHLNYFDYDSLAALLARHGLVEIDRLASFPIEMFLLMGDDYVGNPEVGAACHSRRMAFETSLIESDRVSDLLELYRSLAAASLGRTCAILARKSR